MVWKIILHYDYSKSWQKRDVRKNSIAKSGSLVIVIHSYHYDSSQKQAFDEKKINISRLYHKKLSLRVDRRTWSYSGRQVVMSYHWRPPPAGYQLVVQHVLPTAAMVFSSMHSGHIVVSSIDRYNSSLPLRSVRRHPPTRLTDRSVFPSIRFAVSVPTVLRSAICQFSIAANHRPQSCDSPIRLRFTHSGLSSAYYVRSTVRWPFAVYHVPATTVLRGIC